MNLVTMHRNAHQSHKPWPHRAIVWLLLLAFTMAAATGCVRRRLTVRSNPPGALVYVDNQQIGAHVLPDAIVPGLICPGGGKLAE